MIRGFLLITVLILLASAAFSQRMMGVSTGEWNTMNGMYLNPANLGGCKEKIAVSLFSMNIGVDNSLGTISSLSNINSSFKTGDSGTTNNFFKYSNKSKFSMMLPMLEIRGPGLLFSINKNHTVALTTRVRFFNEFNNFDRTLYNVVVNPSSAAQGAVNLTSKDFNWTAHLWSEIGLSYGGVVADAGNYQIKVGATLRYLGGIGYLGLKGRNLDVSFQNGKDTVYAANSDLEFGSNFASASSAFQNGVSSSKIMSSIFGGSDGKGFGMDVGMILVFKGGDDNRDGYNDQGNTNYKFTISAAITDVGFVKYNSSYNVNVSGNGSITGSGISQNVKDYQDFRNYVVTRGFSADTGLASSRVYLPTCFMIGGDIHAYKRLYANVVFIANMASDQNFGSKYYSRLTITPRYDSKVFTVGMPLTISMLTGNLRMGFGFRCSGFFMGSDDMLALFSNNQYGFNYYFGAMVPICKHKQQNNDYNWR